MSGPLEMVGSDAPACVDDVCVVPEVATDDAAHVEEGRRRSASPSPVDRLSGRA